MALDPVRVRRVLEGVIGIPATEGNKVDVLRNGDEIFPSMLTAIGEAERSIDFLTFVYWTGDISQQFAIALSGRAQQGVRVRVLLDAVGARKIADSLVQRMQHAGCDVRWFRPIEPAEIGDVNNRTHRKILVCDERVGFTGGVGIASEWTGDARTEDEWRDSHFRVEGPAVDGLRSAFLDNWGETFDGPIFDPTFDHFPEQPVVGESIIQVVRGSAEPVVTDIYTLFRTLLTLADETVTITSAYFTPDEALLGDLETCCERGVRIRVLIPGPHADKRFVQMMGEEHYDRMLEAGIEICTFMPSMLHAKIFTVDGVVAAVGSANINSRSMVHDDEVNLAIIDPDVVGELDAHFEHDRQRSEKLDLERWRDRSVWQKTAEKVSDTVSDLF